jgi:hypothetical protein
VALRLGAALTLLVAVLAASVLAGPARGIVFAQDDAGTPATGFQGIAHGVQALADEDIAWRVIREQAPANEDEEAAATVRDLGFVLAEDGALIVDSDGGTRDLLEPGTAAYVEAGATDVRSGLDGETEYYRIELVLAAENSDVSGGELLLAGDAFAGPGAPHLISLDRATIPAGGSVVLEESAAGPTVIIPTVGDIDVVADVDDSVNPVFEGTVIQLYGTGTIESAEGASVVVATLGTAVPPAGEASVATETPVEDDATPAASAVSVGESDADSTPAADAGDEATGGYGLLAIDVLDCSAGSLLDTSTCAPIPGVTLSLITDGAGSTLTADDAGQVSQEIPVGSTVTLSDPTGVPEGLVALNLPFAVDAFAGDYELPIVFSTPNPTPDTTVPDTGDTSTGGEAVPGVGTPIAGDDGTGGPVPTEAPAATTALVTIEALDCTRGDIETLEGCVAMPNATFSVTAGNTTQSGESGYTTDANGYASFSTVTGDNVTATYAFGAPTGIAPNNDGQVIDAIATDTTLTFVFVQVGGPLG